MCIVTFSCVSCLLLHDIWTLFKLFVQVLSNGWHFCHKGRKIVLLLIELRSSELELEIIPPFPPVKMQKWLRMHKKHMLYGNLFLVITTSDLSWQDRTAYLFLLFPSLLLVLRSYIWDGCLPALPVQLYQVIRLKRGLSHSTWYSWWFCFPIYLVLLWWKIYIWQTSTLSSSTSSGVVALPLHRFGSAREHFESEWKWYSSMVIEQHSLLPYVNLTYALCFKFVK